MSLPEITQLVDKLEGETKALKAELFRLSWFMRGGMTIEQAHLLDPNDRIVINELIKNNIEITKESSMPFF